MVSIPRYVQLVETDSWRSGRYRIGREYETFNDNARAKDAYERGIALGDVTSTYRIGMAHLLGQLGFTADVRKALDSLGTAALIAEKVADPETAAPLYVCMSFTP